MNRMERIFSKLVLYEILLLVLFVVGEFTANYYLTHWASEENVLRFASVRDLNERFTELNVTPFAPHRYAGFTTARAYQKDGTLIGGNGFRGVKFLGPKTKGEFRIFLIGGSNIFGTAVTNDTETLSGRMEQAFRKMGKEKVRVINGGCEKWSTCESLIDLEMRVLDLQPDLIVVMQAVEDLNNRLVWPPEHFRGDNTGRRDALIHSSFVPPIWDHSTLLRILSVSLGISEPHASALPHNRLMEDFVDSYLGNEFAVQVADGAYPAGVFQEVPVREILNRNRPLYYSRNLGNLTAVARLAEAEVVFASYPYSTEFGPTDLMSQGDYREGLQEMNQALRESAERLQAHFFNLQGALGEERTWFEEGRYLNGSGYAEAAGLLAEYIAAEELLVTTP